MDAGTLIAGRFEIVAQAGRGGMAAVHRAIDHSTNGYAALKVMHVTMEDAGERFQREAQVLARMQHPGIVGYIANGETPDGRAFIAMNWVEGETLTGRIRRLGRLEPGDVAELGACVAEALAAAHAEGIVHRDVKPSNLLLASDGYDRPVLVDFGIARVGDAASPMTQEGMLIGTPGYISPEQARGSLQIDPRADQFSLACVLYAALTGRAPFRGEDLVGVLAKILFQDTPRVRGERADVPAELEAVLVKAMAKSPDERFADAASMARTLRKIHARLLGADSVSAPSLVVAQTEATTPGISAREARLSAMVLMGRAVVDESPAPLDDASTIGRRFGGDVERLANGALALRFIEAAGASERALAAARSALALRKTFPQAPISLATVRGTGGGEDVVRAIDRAAELVREAPRSTRTGAVPIRIDETTAGLLDARFDVRRGDFGLELVAENGPGDESRKLLGVALPCLGRDRELLTLDATLAEVESERVARAVIVTADAGIGKSRLRREWLHRVRERGSDVTAWIARADPLDASAPYGLLGQAARRAIAIADDAPAPAKQSRLREHLTGILDDAAVARVFPFAAEIIGAPLDASASGALAAARADRTLMAEHIRQAFAEWIVAECKHPLLIVIDDAHWSDAATLRLLDAALKAAADHPLFVGVFARPALRAAHPALFAERRVQELRLEELSKRSAERLARVVLGATAKQDVVDRVVSLSNGNAFFLEELVRAVADGKGAALPDSVLSVVETRLEALEPDARRVLRAASVFGQFFWPGGVAAVLGNTDQETTDGWISALVRREIVSPRAHSRFDDEPELTFRHALVRDTAYSMLTPEDRNVAHRAAASWLEARGECEPAVLAAHFEAGGDLVRAASHYLRAATQMLGSGELAAARELVARGLACAPSDPVRAELLMIDVDAHRWIGDLERCVASAEEVMLLAKSNTDTHLRAMAAALLAHLKLGHNARHLELLAQATPYLVNAEPSAMACRLATTAGVGAVFANDVALASAMDPIIERLAQTPTMDASTLAQIHVFRAFLAGTRTDFEGQIQHFDAAAECHKDAGDARAMLLQVANAAYARMAVGAYDEAVASLFSVLEQAQRLGLQFVVDTAHADLGVTLERVGRYEEARAHAERAVEGYKREGDQRMEAASRAYLATALHKLGRTREAIPEMELAVTLARGASQILPLSLSGLADMELADGRTERALEHAREAMMASRPRPDEARDVFVRLTCARALHACGHTEEATHVLQAAHRHLVHRMELIRDPRYRELFARIEENATVLAWAASGKT
jgi:eukaryotic-like serine/threonine-protein kinase